ncbi:MAG: twitch domain-containing radical SAM protein [Oligoflexia bacterium]|nr:twitch domain-containing radical SAM protein [Oligoflexia bacterium]
MKANDPRLKTFCPLPWNHLSVGPEGKGRVCCDGYDFLKDEQGHFLFWKEVKDLRSYFNSKDYKRIRRQMLNGERPKHCFHCFKQEDHGVKSIRLQYLDQYQKDIKKMIKNTNSDGSVDHPKIAYLDMALGNKCNLKCRMCSPWNSYIIGKDWKKAGISYSEESAEKIFKDKWYSSSNTFNLIKQALPDIRAIFTTGGEPLIVKEHLKILKMIIEKGHAHHIILRYNSNQTVIPNDIVKMWKFFKEIQFNCSVEAYGELNNYIRYPSQWKRQEENIYYLDRLAVENSNIKVFIHTTLQAYNVIKLPQLLYFLRHASFKKLNRFPFFIWVRKPEYLNPSIFPKDMRVRISNVILKSLDEHESFFLKCNKDNVDWISEKIQVLKDFCEMIKNDDSQEKHLPEFVIKTKQMDKVRNQSVLNVLPELKEYFA